eukprot:14092281-Alexandrium_andersonii.AAC.1
MPTAPDLKRQLREQAAYSPVVFSLVTDVKEAHRAVAIDERDWRFLACQVGGAVYVHRRGTYG